MNAEINTEYQENANDTLLAQECAKPDQELEGALAEDCLATDLANWPEY